MSSTEFAGLKFAVGSVKGARSFHVDKLGRLRGINYPAVWKPGENHAQCLRASATGGLVTPGFFSLGGNAWQNHVFTISGSTILATPAPANKPIAKEVEDEKKPHSMDGCTHGFYAYYDGSDDYKTDSTVSAIVEGYGETLIGTRGFRASKARILALCIPGKKRGWPLERYFANHAQITGGITPVATVLTIISFINMVTRTIGLFFTPGDPTPLILWALSFLFFGTLAVGAIKAAISPIDEYETALDKHLLDRVKRNYPDIPVFKSFNAMVKAFPPDREQDPEPDDANFWDAP